MANIQFPIIELENGRFQVRINLKIYANEAVNAACYKYTGLCFIHQEMYGDDRLVATFEAKDGGEISTQLPKEFCNDLIDQQLRFDTNKQYGQIRDLIVEEAFKPVNR